MAAVLHSIIELTGSAGFSFRGAFHPEKENDVPDCRFADEPGTVVLLGNTGGDMWPAFDAGRRDEPDAMNTWTRRTLDALVPQVRALTGGDVEVLYPFDGPPYHPFQRWAMCADTVFPSPTGPLIHPEFGLWHAYRAALVLEGVLDIPPKVPADNPCHTCVDKPCLKTCPVSAFSAGNYDVARCADYLATRAGQTCVDGHCQARRACPVGQRYAYGEAQSRFHMSVFRDLYATQS